ncbi:MAG: N-acetyl-alpha-D-glucosaminyl L-malate synthase BshA [Candidatus Zixiibacteriota bacterium]
MKIGITCYPVVGGSGIVATELGMLLAARGHQVHFISYQLPFRLDQFRDNVFFHQVDVSSYPLFKYPPYTLSLAAKMADVVCRWKLDLLHVHYAIPHATAAFLAKQISGDCEIKVVTTLHGTDITLVGSERSFFEITKFSVDVSDGITTVSEAMRKQTVEVFDIKKPIAVIPNFVDADDFKPGVRHCSRRTFAAEDEMILMHASNFRPVKRVPDVIEIFTRVREKVKCKLILVGDGPEMSLAEHLIGKYGLNDEVMILGNQDSIATILPVADLFLLPSQTESFGLSALEAMACGAPVIASNTGGLPELVTHGLDGYLFPVGDVAAMSDAAIALLSDKSKLDTMKGEARTTAVTRFSSNLMVPRYEDYYLRVIAGRNND